MKPSNDTINKTIILPLIADLSMDTEQFYIHDTDDYSKDDFFSKIIGLPDTNSSIEFKFYYNFKIGKFVILDMDYKNEDISYDDAIKIIKVYYEMVRIAQDIIQLEVGKCGGD